LVEQEKLRSRRQADRDAEPLLLAVGQGAGNTVAVRFEAHDLEHLVDLRLDPDEALAGAGAAAQLVEHRRAEPGDGAPVHIVTHTGRRIDRGVLEGAREPEADHPARRTTGDVDIAEPDLA